MPTQNQNQNQNQAQNQPPQPAQDRTPAQPPQTAQIPAPQPAQTTAPAQNQPQPPARKPRPKLTRATIAQFYDAAVDKQLMHYAASLSFHSVLSLIPLLLISLGIFTKLPAFERYFERLKGFIFESLLPNNQEQIAGYIETFLTNIGSLGVVGFVAVGFTSIMFFGDYIYVIRRLTNAEPRGFWRTFCIYWTTMTLMPIALAVSFWLAALIQRTLDESGAGLNLLAWLPNLIVWAIFGATYAITINREMRVKNLLLASFLSSFAWVVSKWAFVQYTLYNQSYQTIYGSFSVLLFFLLWLYFSWVIFLYGVKVLVLLQERKIRVFGDDDGENSPEKNEGGGA